MRHRDYLMYAEDENAHESGPEQWEKDNRFTVIDRDEDGNGAIELQCVEH